MKVLKKMKIDKRKLLDSSENYEIFWYEMLKRFSARIVDGIFVFKTRKGELLAGSATFFTLLSLSPILLLVITLYGKAVGDVNKAYMDVMTGIKSNFPHLATWIYESLQTIIRSQLSRDSLNWFNIVLLLYTGIGLSNTLVFGMNTLGDVKQRGGYLVEMLKSAVSAVFIMSFILMAMMLSFEQQTILNVFHNNAIMKTILSKSIVQTVMFIGLFSVYFRYITPLGIRNKDGLLGGCVTVGMIMAGKSFYWIYLHYMRTELQQSFGNFYTMIVAVLYIYFIMGSFFFGAAVAFAPAHMRGNKSLSATPQYDDEDEYEEEEEYEDAV
jgi:membrane protein